MELYLKITYLNDFVFCPLSIYYHQLYSDLAERLYYDDAQLNGKAAHSAIDEQRYSTHKNILQGIDVFSEEYKLCGKIDLFDTEKGLLTERKKHIETIFQAPKTINSFRVVPIPEVIIDVLKLMENKKGLLFYDENNKPVRIDTVVVSHQHDDNISYADLKSQIIELL